MAQTIVHKMYGSGVAAANAIASIQLGRKGTITSILLSGNALAGAGTDASYFLELSQSSVSTIGVHDTLDQGIATAQLSLPIANAGGSFNVAFPNVAIPVESGQKLYLHLGKNGTAAASGAWYATIAIAV